MISEKEFDKDAAMLAGLVGGHLNYVDKMSDSHHQVPSNRININAFIDSIRSGVPVRPDRYDPANSGYIPEETVQAQVPLSVPDIPIQLVEANVQQPVAPSSTLPVIKNIQPVASVATPTQDELIQDIKSIKATLLKIDSTFTKISGMLGKVFNHITEKEKSNSSRD
jgi:hypothetical protein